MSFWRQFEARLLAMSAEVAGEKVAVDVAPGFRVAPLEPSPAWRTKDPEGETSG